MTIVLALAALAAALFGAGTYLLLQRALTRVVLGIALLAHGANLLLLVAGGRAGAPPLLDRGLTGRFADPLPQALALTAIVISFGTMALLLTLAWRSWALHGEDEVRDDVEDRRIAQLASRERDAA